MEHRWNYTDRGKPKYSGKKPIPVPLCPPQIPRDRNRASAVRDRRLTAWAMARPTWFVLILSVLSKKLRHVLYTSYMSYIHPTCPIYILHVLYTSYMSYIHPTCLLLRGRTFQFCKTDDTLHGQYRLHRHCARVPHSKLFARFTQHGKTRSSEMTDVTHLLSLTVRTFTFPSNKITWGFSPLTVSAGRKMLTEF
jgi:hypothetical protein